MFYGFDEDNSGTLEFNELTILCDYVYKSRRKRKGKTSCRRFIEKLRQSLDPSNEGMVTQQRFLTVGLEEIPELVSLLISERLLDIDKWSSVLRVYSDDSVSLSPITIELFQLFKANADSKKIKQLLLRESYVTSFVELYLILC